MVDSGHHPDHHGGEERHDEGDQQPSAVGVLADEALEHRHDALPVEDEHGEDGAELDGDGVGVGGVLGGVGVADAEDALGDEQVAGRADRQVLGDALDDAEHDRLPGGHLRSRRRRRRSGRRRRASTVVTASTVWPRGGGVVVVVWAWARAASRAVTPHAARSATSTTAAARRTSPRRGRGLAGRCSGTAPTLPRALRRWGRRRRCPARVRSWRRPCARSSAGWSSGWPGGSRSSSGRRRSVCRRSDWAHVPSGCSLKVTATMTPSLLAVGVVGAPWFERRLPVP